MLKLLTADEVNIDQVIRNHDKWWNNELGRPLFHAIYTMKRPQSPDREIQRYLPAYSRSMSAAQIIENEYYKLSFQRYAADGYPSYWLNFGPGVLAALVGGEGHCSPETVWFGPGKFSGKDLSEMEIKFNPDCEWGRLLKELCEEAAARSHEQPAIIGMTDLGGSLDVLASLCGSQELLLAMIDQPEEVKRLAAEETAAWLEAFDYYDGLIQKGRFRARSCWANIMSSEPNYMLQSDFSYMISPAMFQEFVQGELTKACAKLTWGFYHLDGKGQIGHIPHLAAIPGMHGIQWIPGDGQPSQCHWPEVLEEIEHYGMKLQLYGSLKDVERSLKMLKHPERAHVRLNIHPGEEEEAYRILSGYGG